MLAWVFLGGLLALEGMAWGISEAAESEPL
jgi:hypothetical protein